jgi:hypothetical protein
VIFAEPPTVIVLIDPSRGQCRLDHVGHRRDNLGADR